MHQMYQGILVPAVERKWIIMEHWYTAYRGLSLKRTIEYDGRIFDYLAGLHLVLQTGVIEGEGEEQEIRIHSIVDKSYRDYSIFPEYDEKEENKYGYLYGNIRVFRALNV